MALWWKKKLPLFGSVLFRGELPPQPDEFLFLEGLGINVKVHPGASRTSWKMDLVHPEWGSANLICEDDLKPPPKEIFRFSFIPKADIEAAESGKSILMLEMNSRYEHLLRDRKMMLRFLRAVMGDDGLVAMDNLCGRVWTREQLDDELCHDADLDVEDIINLHVIAEEKNKVFWLHSHGLKEIGYFDFDIIDPCDEVMSNSWDLARAIAFHILEGTIQPNTPLFELVHPRGNIQMVEMSRFLACAEPQYKAKIQGFLDDYHIQRHSVICEPGGTFIGRLFGRSAVRPSVFLSKSVPENPMFSFPNAASDLMAERARKTYPLLRSLREEFTEFGFMYGVKLGITTDDGQNKEHMWFEVHEMFDDNIDATLLNQSYNVSGIKEGDRGRYQIDQISDWFIMTPVGMVNPRSTAAAHMVRENPEAIRQMMKEAENM